MNFERKHIWFGFGESITGASHLRRGAKCQDAVEWLVGSDLAAIAVADGHGDKRCVHSAVGARIAVRETLEVLTEFHRTIEEAGIENLTLVEHIAESCLVRIIVHRWRESVRKAHRLSIGSDDKIDDDELYRLYGTTLVAALAVKNIGLFIQIGDGEILVAQPNGMVFEPVPTDSRLIGNYTDSLSMSDAFRKFRVGTAVFDSDKPTLIMVCTDGVSNSFASDKEFLKLASEYLGLLESAGFTQVVSSMPEFLSEMSHKGSGDDVSLGFLWRYLPKMPAKQRKTGRRNATKRKNTKHSKNRRKTRS